MERKGSLPRVKEVSSLRKVTVTLSEDTLSYMDSLSSETNKRRSDLIREACSLYIEDRRRAILREKMKNGYQEMAEINRLLAEELASDFDCVPAASGEDDEIGFPSWRKV